MKLATVFLNSSLRRQKNQLTFFSKRCLSNAIVDEQHYRLHSEGNDVDVNYSLTEDGVIPVGNAFRNSRNSHLAMHLPSKVANGKATVANISFEGAFKVLEAGHSLSQEEFEGDLQLQQEYLASDESLFVEDAGLGAHSSLRVGARLISQSPAHSLIMRTLMIPTPPRPTDHRASFNGWNKDERWEYRHQVWNGKTFDEQANSSIELKGERPVVAFVGQDTGKLFVQFVQRDKKIVGARILSGTSVSVRGLVEAFGFATCVCTNEQNASALAVPSLALTKGRDTTIVIGANDDAVKSAFANKTLYGAYHNILTESGVTAVWNGAIVPQSSVTEHSETSAPLVVSAGLTAAPVEPNNLAFAASTFVFFESGASKQKLTEEDAVKRLTALSEDTKAELAKNLVKGKILFVVGNNEDIFKLLA